MVSLSHGEQSQRVLNVSRLYSTGKQSEHFVGIMALTVLRLACCQAVSKAAQRLVAASLAYLPTSSEHS
jgi:hypothetical protein